MDRYQANSKKTAATLAIPDMVFFCCSVINPTSGLFLSKALVLHKFCIYRSIRLKARRFYTGDDHFPFSQIGAI
jgi:hypothetical protein